MRNLVLIAAMILGAIPAIADEPSPDGITMGLRWLARHQCADGSWKAAGFTEACPADAPCVGAGNGDYDVALTGLALLAFLGAGYTHLSREHYVDPVTKRDLSFGKVAEAGLRRLIALQAADGCLGPDVPKRMYNHAIATLALAEAYGITNSPIVKEPASRAIEYLIAAQNPGSGWRYTPKSGDSDVSVTGWCVMALKSAEVGGIEFDRRVYEGAKKFILDVTEPSYGKCGYCKLEDAGVKVVIPGKNEDFANHATTTAIGMMVRVFIDRNRKDPMLELGAEALAADTPRWDLAAKTNDYYYWYFGTLALFQVDGPGASVGRHWKPWSEARWKALLDHQETGDGCAAGSWPANDRWGCEGGRIYATSLSVLMMEEYYAYKNVFKKK